MCWPCPKCDAQLTTSPEWRLLRCPACGALLLARRADDGGGPDRVYDIRSVRPPTATRRVAVTWEPATTSRLRSWLVCATAVTLALALGLLAAAWLAR